MGITPDVIVERVYPKEEKDDDKDKKKENGKDDLDKIFSDVQKKDAKDAADSVRKSKEADQKKKDDSDNQLQSALNVMKGLKVYRGFTADH